MIKYITSRPLWFNILMALGVVIILFLLFMFSLNWITRHGHSKTVPAVTGKNINEVSKILDDAGFDLVIQDSLFNDSLPRGIVLKQIPEADQVVKVNRPVYVIINSFATPNIAMPNIVGYSLRNAEMTLQSFGLKLGDTTHKVDFAKGSVLEMQAEGRTLKPGDQVKMGSRIDLVIASGIAIDDMPVPDLVGLTLGEARILLEQKGITLGAVAPEQLGGEDGAYIYDQRPAPRTPSGAQVRISAGQMMNLFVQTDPVQRDSTLNNKPIQ